MRIPPQLAFLEFTPRFLRLLFAPGDRVVLAQLRQPVPDAAPVWTNWSLPVEEAIASVCSQPDQPNLYFRASSHDGSAHYTAANCVHTRGFYLDVDYGTVGHKKKHPAFNTCDDALAYLLTMPLRPTCAWHTGHGIQACFVLDQPHVLTNAELYTSVSAGLDRMALSDGTYTPEHAFRLPLTINDKRWQDPAINPVRGQLLWFEPERVYRFSDIQAVVNAFGADVNTQPATVTPDAGTPIAFNDLPEDIQDAIKAGEGLTGDRSADMFALIGKLRRSGADDTSIHAAIGQGATFVGKYGARLNQEIDRVIQKLRDGRYVYHEQGDCPIEINNPPVDIPLSDCPELTEPMQTMLTRYGQVTGATLTPRVMEAARLYEHVFQRGKQGVIESPCGSGKSTWALTHIAVNAGAHRYVYVTETVDALYQAAETLEQLTALPIGRVHGFNADRCQALCGKRHTFWVCNPRSNVSVCHMCLAQDKCAFFNRDTESLKPVVCLTHAGLIRAIEEQGAVLEDASIIVDESLSPFATQEWTLQELLNLKQHAPTDLKLELLFPFSTLSAHSELQMWDVDPQARTFASRNYVYRDEAQTAALATVYDALRACSRHMRPQLMASEPTGLERARSTLAELLNFFRPTQNHDAVYAYTEARDGDDIRYVCKRSRFEFKTERPYRKLWMLNASAQLCPYPYPANLPVYSCPDIPDNSHLVTVHTLTSNPTKSRTEFNVGLSHLLLCFSPNRGQHHHVLVATDKDANLLDAVRKQITDTHGSETEIVHLTRGRTRGTNIAGNCTLAYITSMSTFTTIDDCALHAALMLRRSYPERPAVYQHNGMLNWHAGQPSFPPIRQYFALRSLDEIYQTIWRTAVRNNQPVEAVIAIPDPHWLVALWRTVMPNLNLGMTYRHTTKGEKAAVPVAAGNTLLVDYAWTFEQDPIMAGLGVIGMPPGMEVTKQQMARQFGYEGERAWERNKQRIMQLIGHWFEDGQTNRVLRRR